MSEHLLGVLQGIVGTLGAVIALSASKVPESTRALRIALLGLMITMLAIFGPSSYQWYNQPPSTSEKIVWAAKSAWRYSTGWIPWPSKNKKEEGK